MGTLRSLGKGGASTECVCFSPAGRMWPHFPYQPGHGARCRVELKPPSLARSLRTQMEPCDREHFRRRALGFYPGQPRSMEMGQRAHRPSLPWLGARLACRPLTNAVPAGGRGLEALVTEAAEGALRVVAEAVAPTHSVVGTLVYVCGTAGPDCRACSHWLSLFAGNTYLFGLLTLRSVKSDLNTEQENP